MPHSFITPYVFGSIWLTSFRWLFLHALQSKQNEEHFYVLVCLSAFVFLLLFSVKPKFTYLLVSHSSKKRGARLLTKLVKFHGKKPCHMFFMLRMLEYVTWFAKNYAIPMKMNMNTYLITFITVQVEKFI